MNSGEGSQTERRVFAPTLISSTSWLNSAGLLSSLKLGTKFSLLASQRKWWNRRQCSNSDLLNIQSGWWKENGIFFFFKFPHCIGVMLIRLILPPCADNRLKNTQLLASCPNWWSLHTLERKEKKNRSQIYSLVVCHRGSIWVCFGCLLDINPFGSLTSSPVPDVTEQLSRAEQNPRCCPGGSQARDRLRGPGEGTHRGRIRSLQQGHALPNSHRR